jgi:aerobic-type carbon monoxide dehydrogenase small subunit (CoxS/CutS family)
MAITITVNGHQQTLDVPPDMPLLWVLRDVLDLTGTKFGCGSNFCGACTVHKDGKAVRSCQVNIGDANGAVITTIEGLGANGPHPVQVAWIKEQVPACGYCQSGQIMAASAFLEQNPDPEEEEIIRAMEGNLCRCGQYVRIKKAVQTAADDMKAHGGASTNG